MIFHLSYLTKANVPTSYIQKGLVKIIFKLPDNNNGFYKLDQNIFSVFEKQTQQNILAS